MAMKIKDKRNPRNYEEAVYLMDRGYIAAPKGAKTRQEALKALREEHGAEATAEDNGEPQGASKDEEGSDQGTDYESWNVDALNEEIDRRNAERDEDDEIQPDSGRKADLIAALELDDEDEF